MKKTVTILFCLIITYSLSSEGWEHRGYLPDYGIHDISYHPDKNLLYALTDNFYSLMYPDSLGAYLYRSYNKGKNWEKIQPQELLSDNDHVFNQVYLGCSPHPNYYFVIFRRSYRWIKKDSIQKKTWKPGYILKSSDGGKNFKIIEIDNDLKKGRLYYIAMLDTNVGLIYGSSNFYVTFNSWKTCEKRSYPAGMSGHELPTAKDSANIHMIYYGAFGDYDNKYRKIMNYNIYKDKWTFLGEVCLNDAFNLYDLTYVNDTLGFICGSRNKTEGLQRIDVICRTKDGGKSWENVLYEEKSDYDTFHGLSHIDFYDEKNGIAVGRDHDIYMTNNGGNSWNYTNGSVFSDFHGTTNVSPIITWAGKVPVYSYSGHIFTYHGDFFKFDDESRKPELLIPSDSSIVADTSIRFQWKCENNNGHYVFKLSDDLNFSSTISEHVCSYLYHHHYDTLKNRDVQYFWKVGHARKTDTLWSDVSTFRFKMGKPKLIYPEHESSGININTTFKWTRPMEAENFHYEITTDKTFKKVDFSSDKHPNANVRINGLKLNTKYHWRVKAYNNYYESNWSDTSTFRTSGYRPANLIYPENNATGLDTTIKFRWDGIDQTDTYKCQISRTKDFDSIIKEKQTYLEYCEFTGFEIGREYYWRVIQLHDNSEEMSEIYKFSTKINTPEPVFPKSNTGGHNRNLPLIWTKSYGADFYEFEVARDSNFNETIIRKKDILGKKYDLKNLDSNRTYYWHVRAYNSEVQSNWSDTAAFRVGEYPIAVLIYPENHSVKPDTSIELKWKGFNEAEYYILNISEDSNFNELLLKDEVLSEEYKYDFFSMGIRYYWNVNLKYDEVLTTSDTFSFIIQLDKPLLKSPKDGSYGLGTDVQLEWYNIENEKRYELQVAEKKDFSNIIFKEDILTEARYLLENLDSGKTYYWRVKAYNDITESQWSEAWQFTLTPVSSVKANGELSKIRISPNPVEDILKIETEAIISGDAQIISTTGKTLITVDLKNQSEIDVSDLTPGVYFVKIGGKVEKFVKN